MGHNDIRDTFFKLKHDVCYDVEVEPTHQLLHVESFVHKTTSTDKNARLNIKVSGLWEPEFSRFLFDVMILNPLAFRPEKVRSGVQAS